MAASESVTLVDKLGQEIKVGMWIIKPWDGEFDIGRVTQVNPEKFTFRYEYPFKGYDGQTRMKSSLCKVPWRCLAVPEILQNYWSILQ